MDAFVWDERFATGLETIDGHHRRLVDLINLVGEMFTSHYSSDDDLQTIFRQLADYARFHFAQEERLMDEVGVDSRCRDQHRRRHAEFIEQVMHMWRNRATSTNPAQVLHTFLTSWLSFHILDEDHSMARQIFAIRSGMTPTEAYTVEKAAKDNNVAALLSALQKLYQLMALQNQELIKANSGLEQKVAERTRELTLANERLDAEQKELASVLVRMEEAQNHVLQSEKMVAIGQLAAGVAHEINNPIGFVNSNLGTLKTYVERLVGLVDSYDRFIAKSEMRPQQLAIARQEADFEFLRDDVITLLGESRDGLDRVKKIVQDLKDFSHIDETELEYADINAGLESTLNVVWNELKYKAEVHRQYGQLPPVRCIAGQVNQVFMNLLINAAQAIDAHGTITIRTGSEGTEVWIEIADTGCGMSPEVKKRVFEPFFTTKPVGKGTGLGLSLSYDIVVKKHGGRLELDSHPGRGTTFHVWLPIGGPQV